MKYRILLFLLVSFLMLSLLIACSEDDDNDGSSPTELQIAALIPETGGYSNQGAAIKAAINFAVEDVNEDFESRNLNTEIDIIISDTQTDPDIATALANTFIDQDFRFIIGPVTSAEVQSVSSSINNSQSILISPSSTMIDLAIADNIYRIVPDDEKMVEATVQAIASKNITNLAVIYIGNDWGNSLLDQMQTEFEANGGTFLGAVEFFGSRESEIVESIDSLSSIMELYLETGNQEDAAIQLMSFDAGSVVLDVASSDTTLAKFKWFGTDGFVNNSAIISDFPDAAEFASMVEYTAPIYGITASTEYTALIDRIEQATGTTAGVYSVLAYDAVLSAANALQIEGQDATLNMLKIRLTNVLADNPGLSGNITLNSAADRADGSYFFWTLEESGGNYSWVHTMSYENGVIVEQ